jgi:TPP-dependent pyruvate/acetoin dehydrogenase alpha subunit
MNDTIKKLGKEKLTQMYKRMVTIRKFEERVRYLFLEGIMPGTIHQCDGQEAVGVGVCSALQDGDVIASTHRPHGHAIAKGLTLNEMMAELFGKVTGCCKGYGGSMHLGNMEKGMIPSIAIVGGNMPIVAGFGLGFKLQNKKNVAVAFFGDGAANEGAFHEAVNFAAMYKLPAIFVCENNLYGASTHIKLTCQIENIADRAAGYGIEGVAVDGNDLIAVYDAAWDLIEKAREGKGPAVLELKTYRQAGQSRRDAKKYMEPEEMKLWFSRDPIPRFEKVLLEAKILNQADFDAIAEQVDQEIEDAIEFAQSSPLPKPEDALKGVFA